MEKFKLVKTIKIEDVIFNSGTLFEPNDDGLYEFKLNNKIITKPKSFLLNKEDTFEVLCDEIESDILELDLDEEEEIKKWRIQLDVKTSRKKLIIIKSFFDEKIKEML